MIGMNKMEQMSMPEIEKFIREEVRCQLSLFPGRPCKLYGTCQKRLGELEKQIKIVLMTIETDDIPDLLIPQKKKVYRMSGESLKRIRVRYGLTQTDAAILLDTTLTSVNRWERGKLKPCAKTKEKIAQLRQLGKRNAHKLLQEKQKIQKENSAE